jgi:holliday junction DNA helicase RuvB
VKESNVDDFEDNLFDDNPFDEPAIDINAAVPTSLSHIVGQRSVIEQVKVGLDSCQMDATKFDHSLLVGPPGLGKTAVAKIIAEEMAADFCEVLGQSIKTAADLNAVLLGATEKSIVFIDEAHELRTEFQTALYLSLDKGKVIVSGGKKPQSIGLSDFSLLLATTDEHCLLAPLRDRMKLVLRFDFYTHEELRTLIEQRAKALKWQLDDCTVLSIANRARGTPRIALRLLQACRRVCRAEGETDITAKHLLRACELEQMDDLGLGPCEKRYLLILADGGSRLNVIASTLGLPTRTVSQVVEPFLIRLGLILKDDQGRRELSARGREHLFNPFRSQD